VVVRSGGATVLALYGRRLWETGSSHWPTGDQQSGATPAEIEFARRWRDMPKVVFSHALVTHPVLVSGGTPFFAALNNWVSLNLVETRTFRDGVLLTRYETRR